MDRSPHNNVAEMERPRVGRNHYRETERRTVIWTCQIHGPGLVERGRTGTRGGRGRPDLRRRRTPAGVVFRGRDFAVAALREPGDLPDQPLGHVDRQPRQVLFAIVTGERERERAVSTRGRRGRTGAERGAESSTAARDRERRGGRGRVGSVRSAPRREIRGRRGRTARLRVRQRRTGTTV